MGRSIGQWNLTKTICSAFEIDFPSIEFQQKIVKELDSQMLIISDIRQMKTEAEKKIGKILADVWGVESFEPEKVEVEDGQEN
jgi:restriction endonuclease S subunit